MTTASVISEYCSRCDSLPLRVLCWWLAPVAVFGAGVAVFDDLVYGGPLTTGYPRSFYSMYAAFGVPLSG
jgi:hypothetical protein